MAEQFDDRTRIQNLAQYGRQYKAGLRQMLEGGYDEDELQGLIDEAETELAEEEKARAKRVKTRRLVKKF